MYHFLHTGKWGVCVCLCVCFIHSNTSLALQLLSLGCHEVRFQDLQKLLNSVLIILFEITQNDLSVALKGLRVVAPL